MTLFGIILVFALAVNRGWIGPTIRCLIGAAVSALLVGGALWIRRRFGFAASALAGAGAGIGGFYVTLYAASRGYHLLGNGFVWAAVVITAALAVTLAVSWKSELLAVLGLGAVVIAPWVVEGRLSGTGLGASLCAAAAAVAVGQRERWRTLGGLSYGLALAQLAVYVVGARSTVSTSGSTGSTAARQGCSPRSRSASDLSPQRRISGEERGSTPSLPRWSLRRCRSR